MDEARQTARLVLAAAGAAEATAACATATAAAATTTAAAATATTAVAAAAAIIPRGTAALLAADTIDHEVELTARHAAVRTLLALVHAHEADLLDVAGTDDVERLEEARGAIGLHGQRGGDRVDRRIGR